MTRPLDDDDDDGGRNFNGRDSYRSLMYTFRIPVTTISKIIPEVCKALYEILKEDYLKGILV
ncbi:hypothetical protein Hamer_G024367 [Homarus americanus]|uniref:Uncharacterized protein n=1 Tax=Homarus americanus TaxID=6706 RepID=A0A8J5ML21_HOMAM|nr:hypothetical protein Hamer_G024367 [Homarus americanus]